MKEKKNTMSEIKTFVYFDLEATGLRNSGRPRITELSFVAVNTKDVLELHSKLMTHLQGSQTDVESILPRIMNKLTVCVYPMAIIRPEVSEITGLDNYNLSGQARFDRETGELLNSFLAHLTSPLCLVAHNGNKYDFPLLKAELEKVGITLPCNTLCADSYLGIKEIVSRKEETTYSETENMIDNQTDIKIAEISETPNITQILDAEYGDIERENSKTPRKSFSLAHNMNAPNVNRTLKLKLGKIEITPNKRFTRLNGLEKTNQLQSTVRLKSKKKLDFFAKDSPKSFSLINLHKRLVGSLPTQSHGAEADCLTLLRTTAVLGMEWVQWVQDNCSLFSNCRKMWSYTK